MSAFTLMFSMVVEPVTLSATPAVRCRETMLPSTVKSFSAAPSPRVLKSANSAVGRRSL